MKILALVMVAATSLLVSVSSIAADMPDVAKKYNCTACHTIDKKLVGPSWQAVADKYKGDASVADKLGVKIAKGGVGVYGPIPMPANPKMTDADIKEVVAFILALAK